MYRDTVYSIVKGDLARSYDMLGDSARTIKIRRLLTWTAHVQ